MGFIERERRRQNAVKVAEEREKLFKQQKDEQRASQA
jgi:hypothetical protein